MGQNVTPRLRIIFQALLGPKTKLKKNKKNKNVENPDFFPFKVINYI